MDTKDLIIKTQDELMPLDKFIFWLNSMTTTELHKEFPGEFHILKASDSIQESVTNLLANDAILWIKVKEHAQKLRELCSRLEPDKGYRTVPFELSEETWKKLTPIERMKFKGLLLEKIPVEPKHRTEDSQKTEPDKKSAEEILNKYDFYGDEGDHIVLYEDAIEAMEEYANECVKAKCTIPVVSGSLPLVSDDEIKAWVDEVQPIRGGYKSDYIYAAKSMRDGKVISLSWRRARASNDR